MDFEENPDENNEDSQKDQAIVMADENAYLAFEQTQQQAITSSEEMVSADHVAKVAAPFTTYAFQTKQGTFYECLQEVESVEYTEDQINRLKTMFEAS